MANTSTPAMDPANYEALKEQLRREIMMTESSRPSVKGKTMTNLRDELLNEMERQEELRQRRAGDVVGNRLNEGRENWQEFKDDLLSGLEERMQEWPLLGDRHQNRRNLTERQLLNELRDELKLDLQAGDIYRRHWQKHPRGYGRLLLQDLLQEAEEQGYTRAELLQAVQGVQGRGTMKGKINNWLATPEGRGFKYGAMAAALAIILWPAARKNLEPLLKGIVREGMEAGENIQSFFSGVVEDFQDIFAEAQFERTKDILDKEIANGINLDPDTES